MLQRVHVVGPCPNPSVFDSSTKVVVWASAEPELGPHVASLTVNKDDQKKRKRKKAK
jgi:hypothetical protein